MTKSKLINRIKKSKLVYLIIVIAFSFLVWNIYKNWTLIASAPWRFDVTSFFLMVIFLFLGYLANIAAWHFLTRALGVEISFWDNFKIWIFSNLTRFLPGKIWQYPSRIYLLTKKKVPVVLSGTATLAEMMFNLSYGAVSVFISLSFWRLPNSLVFIQEQRILLFLLPLPFLFVLFANSKIISAAVLLIKRLTKKDFTVLNKINFSKRWFVPVSLAFFSRFLLPGGALFFLTKSLVAVDSSLFMPFVGAFSLSWLLGYVSIFAPAGLGVAEVSLATILSLYMPFAVASIVVIAFRVLILISELIFLGISVTLLRDLREDAKAK